MTGCIITKKLISSKLLLCELCMLIYVNLLHLLHSFLYTFNHLIANTHLLLRMLGIQYYFIYFNHDLSREFRMPISSFSPSADEIHFQKEFFEGNLLFNPPNVIISWVRSVSNNTYNW